MFMTFAKKEASTDGYSLEKAKWYKTRLDELMPQVGYESDQFDELRCEECNITFHEIKEFRTHYSEIHPNLEPKFKRKVQHDDKKSRRNKGPTK